MWRRRSTPPPQFRDRTDAGQQLADALLPLLAGIPRDRLLVLGLARGGVVLAVEVAKTLGAELDACVVRKIGAPAQPELAIGAVGPGDSRLFNRHLIASIGLAPDSVQALAGAASAARDRLDGELRGNRPAPLLEGRTVVLVDDGLATGASMRAALAWVKDRTDAVIVAVPVAPPDVIAAFEALGAQVTCLVAERDFGAVGSFYERFDEVTSADVRALLQSAWEGPPDPRDGRPGVP